MPRLLLALFALADVARCQNAWVRRNKKDGDKVRVEEDAPVEEDLSEFERMNRLVKQLGGDNEDGASLLEQNRRAMAGFGGAEGDMDAMWEGMMDSPEVQALLQDPSKIREMLVDNPILNAMPGMAEQIEAALNSEAFSDPAKLQAAMKEGMETFKTVGKEFSKEIGKNMMDMLENPEKMAEAMKQLGDPKALEESMKLMMGGAGGEMPDMAAMSKMLGQDLSPEQLEEAMAETQKLLQQMGVGGDAFADFGLGGDDGANTQRKMKRGEL